MESAGSLSVQGVFVKIKNESEADSDPRGYLLDGSALLAEGCGNLLRVLRRPQKEKLR